MSTWLVEHVEQLVGLYKEHPELWDCSVKEYYNKDDRSKAIRQISREMRKPEADILKKIKCLRTYYCRELRGMNAASEKARWMHFESLDFLRDHVTLKAKTAPLEEDAGSNASLSEVHNADFGQHSNAEWSLIIKDEPLDDLEDDVNSPLELQLEPAPSKPAQQQPQKSHTTQSPLSQPPKRPPLKRKPSPHSRTEAWIHQSKEPKVSEDDCESGLHEMDFLFGKIVSEELRHVKDPQLKQLTKLRIQALLFEARFNTSIEMKSTQPNASRSQTNIPSNSMERNRGTQAESSSTNNFPKSPQSNNLSPIASPM